VRSTKPEVTQACPKCGMSLTLRAESVPEVLSLDDAPHDEPKAKIVCERLDGLRRTDVSVFLDGESKESLTSGERVVLSAALESYSHTRRFIMN
jgi:hypothetical protein